MAAGDVSLLPTPKTWEKGIILNQNIFDEIQSDIHSTAYRRRHRYIEDEVMVDGITYKVISVVPFADGNYRPETVQDKLEYLINGKQS
ncbi:MAG: hypothetical protein ACI3VZ_06050 [Faecousia sp.]